MTKENEKMHFPKVTLDNYFTTQEERDNENKDYIESIPIKDIDDYPNHPFSVNDDELMDNIVKSINNNGFIPPSIIRPKENGKFEMVSGHRRKRAFIKANRKEMPCIIRKLTDEEATILMVDTNINQRQKILPSERAFAYKMKLEAMKRKAGRPKKENSSPMAKNFNNKGTAEIIGEEFGEGKDNVYRYIRLTELIPEILKLVDEEKMKLRPAVEISYLKSEEQEYLFESIEYTEVFPSHPQAREMRKLSLEGKLSEDEIDRIMSAEKPNQIEQVKFRYDKVKDYFPKGYTVQQMQNIIERLLQKYQMQWQKERQAKKYDR